MELKEYIVMLIIFMVIMVVFDFMFSAIIISWLIIGRATLIKRGVKTKSEGFLIYWFYFTWPRYIK